MGNRDTCTLGIIFLNFRLTHSYLEISKSVIGDISAIKTKLFNFVDSCSNYFHRYHTVFLSQRILCKSWLCTDVKKEGSIE